MKYNAMLLFSYILLSMVVAFPCSVHSQEISIPLDQRTQQLIEQLQDIDLLQCKIAQSYQAENKSFTVSSLARQSVGEPAELDDKLLDRVFRGLAGAAEYEKFMVAYQAVIQRPDYNRLYASELYGEYMRLLDSARTRLTIELKQKAAGS